MPRLRSRSPVQVRFPVLSLEEGKRVLEHLTEERLIAGGVVVQADALHWVGGTLTRQFRKEITAYTTLSKLPLIRRRLQLLAGGGEAPLLSQFFLTGEAAAVQRWIEQNVRK